MRPRSEACLPLLALLLGCGPNAPGSAPTLAGAPSIEASRPAAGDGRAAPIDRDDPEAKRCLDRALDSQGSAPSATTPCAATAPAACARSCRLGDTQSCRILGESLLEADPTCAARLWDLSCERGQLDACTALGELLLGREGDGTSEALALLRRACDGNHAAGCTALGRHLANETDAGEDLSAAVALLEKGCALGDGAACRLGAVHRAHGVGVPMAPQEGATLARRGCELGDAGACTELATAILYGHGVPQDQAKALAMLEQICALDEEETGGSACYLAGPLASPGGAQVGARAEALYGRACDKGHFDGCSVTATLHYQAGRYEQAVAVADGLIADQPRHWPSRNARGLSLFDLGRYAEAAEDLAVLTELRTDWPYGQLWLYIARSRSGQDGKIELGRWLKTQDPSTWPVPVARMYLGELSPEQLLRAAQNDAPQKQLEQQCEAFYYLSQREQIAGRRAQARRWLDKTVATGVTDFIEYASAQAELSRWPAARKPSR